MVSLILVIGVPAALIALLLYIIRKRNRANGSTDYQGSTPLDSGFKSDAGAATCNGFDGFGAGESGGGGASGSWCDSSDTGSSDSGGDGGGDGGGD
jgi:uncharacterized membrane protein YgcG